MCKKHKLKIDIKRSTTIYFLAFVCSECGYIYVANRIMLRNLMLGRISGSISINDLIYRAWNPYEFTMEKMNAN